ncbi:MAG: 4'-phosphopantetheinyl transferase superfamily protein [Synechococcaceae cyanobacterium SM2_3_2]|nr:4'-phosphopantetheinyl transferase superfamily protein [Synechococcaceae cyanobacterium SM2_3_2]
MRRSEVEQLGPVPALGSGLGLSGQISPLTPAELHLWGADLDSFNPDHWDPLLSSDEQARAEQMRVPEAQRRFVTGRGLLRTLLGQYLGQDPAQIRLAYGSQGKPYLKYKSCCPLAFNLAHSGSLVVMAFGRQDPIGVDVEQVRPRAQMERVARRRFTPSEYAHWQQVPESQRLRVFLQIWTAKEACLKAEGLGIRHLRHVEWIPPGLVADRMGSPAWHLYRWDPTPTTVATLALPLGSPPWATDLRWGWIPGGAVDRRWFSAPA